MPTLSLRPWRLSDAEFIIELRNRPELMRWFRQSEPITLDEQVLFMVSNEGFAYNGQIILLDGQPIGIGAVKHTGELSLVLPDNYKLYRKAILVLLIRDRKGVWGEVFTGNDIAEDLETIGFKSLQTLYVRG